MANVKKKQKEQSKKISIIKENFQEVNIGEFCRELMLIFGANNNLARMIPDIRDGLKLVERRVLYDMFAKLKIKTTTTKKVGRIVGDTTGLFHPHGESSVYEVIVALGQWWKNYPLYIKRQGNFGSIHGAASAAQR